MGREIRRVPPDWEHPKFTAETTTSRNMVGQFVPLYDSDFDSAADAWETEFDLWRSGAHKDRNERRRNGTAYRFWEWHGKPPSRDSYRDRKWTEKEATHFQVYETVSEGTPVTPHFATEAELVDYLVEHGTFWDQHDVRDGRRRVAGWKRENAELFVGRGDAPSMVVVNGTIYEPRDGSPFPPVKESGS